MKNVKNLWLGSTALLLLACNNVEIGFVPLYAVRPDVSLDPMTNATVCAYDPGGPAMPFITVNVAAQSAMSLIVVAENQMQEKVIELQASGPQETLIIPNHIQPLRFDYRWECDSTGFTADQGPLIVPAFSPDRPFCLDQRDDTTGDFVGFDVVPASGPNIQPQSTGLMETRIIPPQLAEGIRDTFELAILADRCCREVGGCSQENLQMRADGSDPATACGQLQQVFDRVAGTMQLSVNQVTDVQKWRPFVTYTTQNGTGIAPVPYGMRLRGRYEGLTPTGALVTSTEYSQDIGFCAGCAVDVANACLNR